jgi:hypothetical protein
MEALTPASPDRLPPLGELIADEPFWRFPPGTAGRCQRHVQLPSANAVRSAVHSPGSRRKTANGSRG